MIETKVERVILVSEHDSFVFTGKITVCSKPARTKKITTKLAAHIKFDGSLTV